jgi:histidyl-tRNA synthetase
VGAVSGPTYRAVKGTRDLFPPESQRFARAEAVAERIFGSYGYGEVRTPCLEATELFTRSVGETTDIVHKEMYTFPDRKGRSLSLRPENTAGVVRAVIERGLAAGPMPLRLWYTGPQFRYERPQAARYREFRQIGVELFGVPGPAAEVEVLAMLFVFLGALGFRSLSVSLNSVGTASSRDEFGEALRAYLEPRSAGFGEDDRRKLVENPLRLFDSKDAEVRAALEGSPRTLDFLDGESRRHHEEVRRLLGQARIPFRDEPSLVRGLDYYTRTVFEVVSADLGAQDAILGGGRYDNLVESLGGPSLTAIGFAIGEDRLLQAAPAPAATRPLFFVLPQNADDLEEALRLADELRAEVPGSVEVDLLARGFKKAMARANAIFEEAAARGLDREKIFAVLIGAREREEGMVTFKRLATSAQETVPRGEAVRYLAGLLEARP